MDRLIKNDLEIMLNCLLAEKRRIYNLKQIVVNHERYEYSAKLHEIEKKLDEVIETIQK